MNNIKTEYYFTGNTKFSEHFSLPQKSNKYLWLNDPFTVDNTKHEMINKTSAAGFVLMAASLLMFSKGFQKHSKIIFEKISAYFDKKTDKTILYSGPPKNNINALVSKKISSFLHKLESVNNITTFKDILFMKFMYKTRPTKKIHNSISQLFEKISRKTVATSYNKTQKKFDSMYAMFDKLDEYILKNYPNKIINYKGKNYTTEELITKAKDYRENVKIVVNTFISPKTLQLRYGRIKESTSSLYSDLWNESLRNFWKKENKSKRNEIWQTFIAAEQVKANKTELAQNVAFARNMLSYTSLEKSAYIAKYLKNLKSIVPYKDKQGEDIIKRMEWYMKDLSGLSDNRENFLKELENFEKHPLKFGADNNSMQAKLEDKAANIEILRTMVKDDDTGELGDMLSIYRSIVPFELSKSGAMKQAKQAVESFDKSVQLETEEFFDKLRDLELGSAPTDILTLVLSSWMIILGLQKAKNSDEKKSVMLKSGIPTVGGIITTMLCTSKLVSGGKSLALGILSGLVLNRAGTIADNLRKNYDFIKS